MRARAVAHDLAPVCAARRAQESAVHRHQPRLRGCLWCQQASQVPCWWRYRKRSSVSALWRCLRRVRLSIVEMGVEDKMTPADHNGGYSHPTTRSTVSDPIMPSVPSLNDSVKLLVGIGARQQVLLSTLLPPSSHFPPRSGCLAVLGYGAVLWPEGRLTAGYRLEGPVGGICRRGNQSFGVRMMV